MKGVNRKFCGGRTRNGDEEPAQKSPEVIGRSRGTTDFNSLGSRVETEEWL